MKKLFVSFILLIASLTLSFSQTETDSITMKKVFGYYQFYQGDTRLNFKQLVDITKVNEQAYKEMKSAQLSYTFASILGYAGGFMIGWTLGTAIAGGEPDWDIAGIDGGEPNWALAGIGAGLIVVSIPISQNFNKKAEQAVSTYNNGLQTSSFWDDKELNLTTTRNGIGLTFNF